MMPAADARVLAWAGLQGSFHGDQQQERHQVSVRVRLPGRRGDGSRDLRGSLGRGALRVSRPSSDGSQQPTAESWYVTRKARASAFHRPPSSFPLTRRLKDGMAFNLSVGLQGVPLPENERRGSGAQSMQTFAMVIAGTVGPVVSFCFLMAKERSALGGFRYKRDASRVVHRLCVVRSEPPP